MDMQYIVQEVMILILLENNMKKGITYANEFCNFLSNKNLELTGIKNGSGTFKTEELKSYYE